ncbi:MAG: hypothetical protein R3B90_15100 [Planctomycetaceae bacterium]
MPQLTPLLAVDVGGLVAIAFMVISFIGWISNLINGNQPGKRPDRNRQQRPRDKQLRQEIDEFLQDNSKRRSRRRDEEAELLSADEIEVVDKPRPVRRRPTPRPRQQSVEQPTPSSLAPADLSARHLETSLGGNTMQQKAQQYLAEQARKQATQQSAIQGSVSQHLGVFTAESSAGRKGSEETTRQRSTPATALLKMLRSKQGSVRRSSWAKSSTVRSDSIARVEVRSAATRTRSPVERGRKRVAATRIPMRSTLGLEQ